MMVGRRERLEFRRILDELFGWLDAKRLGQTSVALPLSAFSDTFQLDLFLRSRIAKACATGGSLLQVAAGARLDDGCELAMSIPAMMPIP